MGRTFKDTKRRQLEQTKKFYERVVPTRRPEDEEDRNWRRYRKYEEEED